MSAPRTYRRTPGLIFALVALVVPKLALAQTDAVEILQRSIGKEIRATYQGVQETVVKRGLNVQRTEQRVRHKAPNKHRVDYDAPAPVQGNLLIDDGTWTWQYFRRPNVVEKTASLLKAARRLQNQIQHAVRQGAARVEYQGEETIAGRPAHKIVIFPARQPGRQREVWLDKEYGVVLRARDVAAGGAVTDTAFRTIEFEVTLEDALFVWNSPAGAVESEPDDGPPIPLLRARQIATRNWGGLLIPSYLPPGYALRSAHQLRWRGGPIVHLRFSDGERTISLFQSASGPSPQDIRTLRRDQAARKDQLFPFKRGRVTLLLVGPLALPELQKIADSIEGGTEATAGGGKR